MGFQNNLRKLRKDKHLTQEQLARAVKIDRTTISSYERGLSEPTMTVLQNIANVFDVKVEELTK